MLSSEQLLQIRESFPFYSHNSSKSNPIYLDNAATTQKAAVVIDCINELWRNGSANVHRSSHSLANNLTRRYEDARLVCSHFINAKNKREIIWTSGATEAINLVANSWGMDNLTAGDEILISKMEHHANLIPWQQLCKIKGVSLKIIPITETAEIDLLALNSLLNSKVKLVAITHISNVLGTVNPIKEIIELCHKVGAIVLVDGAQAVAHIPVDVQQLDCDFYVFSGHKCFAPESTGVLYGKLNLLEAMSPWKTGGEMVKTVSFTSSNFQPAPLKFEAGTPNISGIIALSKALTFINSLDRKSLFEHEQYLTQLAKQKLLEINNIKLHSTAKQSSSIISFSINNINAMDLSALLDEQNIAIRSGQLCAMPLVRKLNNAGVLRVSFCFYNSTDEVIQFIETLKQSIAIAGG
ncbi:MAG: cysteine desulfurase [Gammaproteobacteria bacterium]|nr:cysteine desulfurase [Gammaproteobacteria bacterium]